MKPSNSTIAGVGIGVPLAIIVAWILTLFGVVMPPEVQTALGAILSPIAGYFFIGGKKADTEDDPNVAQDSGV
jgi:uncharacterized membrane protein YfbV (UPF0208 family)